MISTCFGESSSESLEDSELSLEEEEPEEEDEEDSSSFLASTSI